jgi:hypothetical protein
VPPLPPEPPLPDLPEVPDEPFVPPPSELPVTNGRSSLPQCVLEKHEAMSAIVLGTLHLRNCEDTRRDFM